MGEETEADRQRKTGLSGLAHDGPVKAVPPGLFEPLWRSLSGPWTRRLPRHGIGLLRPESRDAKASEGSVLLKKSRFTEEQIIYAIKQREAGVPIDELCRKYGITQQTFYRWRKKYGGLTPSELRRLKDLEAENRRLKQLVADLALDKEILKDVLSKKL